MTRMVRRNCLAPGLLALAALVMTAPKLFGQLVPTVHTPLPRNASDLWLVPADTPAMARASTVYEPLAQAAQAIADGELERALTLASRPALASGPLADHALYYKGLAHLRLTRAAEAREIFEALRKRNPAGYLSISLALGEAEVSTALGDHARALGIYEKLTADKVAVSDLILLKQAEAARAVGDRSKAAEALVRVYYEYALSDSAVAAAADLEPLRDLVVQRVAARRAARHNRRRTTSGRRPHAAWSQARPDPRPRAP